MRGGPHTQKSSLTVGKSAGTETDLWGIKGECSGHSVEGRTKNCMHGLHCSSAHSGLSCELPVAEGGWVLESGVWSADPGRGQLLAVKRQPEGTGVRSSTTRKVCGKSPGYHRRCHCSVVREGWSHHYNPFPHPPASSASTGTERGSHLSRPTCPSSWGLCPWALGD